MLLFALMCGGLPLSACRGNVATGQHIERLFNGLLATVFNVASCALTAKSESHHRNADPTQQRRLERRDASRGGSANGSSRLGSLALRPAAITPAIIAEIPVTCDTSSYRHASGKTCPLCLPLAGVLVAADRDDHRDCIRYCDLDCGSSISYCDVDFADFTCSCIVKPWFIAIMVIIPVLCIAAIVGALIARCMCGSDGDGDVPPPREIVVITETSPRTTQPHKQHVTLEQYRV